MDRNTLVKVLNRDNGAVVYEIPEMNGLTRYFGSGEVKEITFEELQKLSYIPGGLDLIKECLMIEDKEAVKQILGHVEIEYFYDKDKIKDLMLHGSLDSFKDCLDFAPEGVKELIKNMAVELPLNDVAKRDAIYEQLGFNVDNAIRIKRESEGDGKEYHPASGRRVAVSEEDEKPDKPVRRIVSK